VDRVETHSWGQKAQKERRGFVMKKAILIICVLSVLALLVIPVMAGVLSADSDLDQLALSKPRPPSRGNALAKVERPTQIAWGGFRSPKPQG
jgi:hypothetical protein